MNEVDDFDLVIQQFIKEIKKESVDGYSGNGIVLKSNGLLDKINKFRFVAKDESVKIANVPSSLFGMRGMDEFTVYSFETDSFTLDIKTKPVHIVPVECDVEIWFDNGMKKKLMSFQIGIYSGEQNKLVFKKKSTNAFVCVSTPNPDGPKKPKLSYDDE